MMMMIYLIFDNRFVVVQPGIELPSAEFPPPPSSDGSSSNPTQWST